MIAVVSETASTNADMLMAARDGAAEGMWLRAERQSAGRGRLDRRWASPPGNVYASTIVRLQVDDPAPPTLALAAGVALHDATAAHVPDAGLFLKWPNDLVAAGAKLAGILLERRADAVVVGFGVNVASHPELADRRTTSLAALGATIEPHALCLDLAAAFARWLVRWRSEGLSAIRASWLDRAHPAGTALTVIGPHGTIAGLFDGLEPDGSLRLRRADGSVEIVRSGDVSLL